MNCKLIQICDEVCGCAKLDLKVGTNIFFLIYGFKKCFNVKNFFLSFFLDNGKNSGDLLLILGVPTPKFRGTYLEGGVTKG